MLANVTRTLAAGILGLYTVTRGKCMLETMTLDEKLSISRRAFELLDAGDEEGFSRLLRTAPMPPYLAKIYKEKVGVKELIESGWNLSEADAEFGEDWLSR